MNRLTIGLITVLFVISIGVGSFAFVLNGRIGGLYGDVQAFRAETTSQFGEVKEGISMIGDSLNSFKSETKADLTALASDITSLDNSLGAFKQDTNDKFNTVQRDIATINADITEIDAGLAGLDASFNSLKADYDESTMNVRRIYDDVIVGVCQIVGNSATGSGFVYDVEGDNAYIVTCWHVVNNQLNIDVVLHDGTVKRAAIVGSDRNSDIAVIRINGVANLRPLPLADSSTLVPGEPVIVVGNPFGIFETVVYGVISRTRGMVRVGGVGWVSDLIQYDAPQNPGNSGGPVFNREGQVIGIANNSNTAAEGIHNAISANKVKRVADALISSGSFTSCILPGEWEMDNLEPATAISRGLSSTFGFIFLAAIGVGDVQVNDICIAVDGLPIKDYADFFSYTSLNKSVGDTITLTLLRGSGSDVKQLEVTLTLVSGWPS